jgi:hypothetical protein
MYSYSTATAPLLPSHVSRARRSQRLSSGAARQSSQPSSAPNPSRQTPTPQPPGHVLWHRALVHAVLTTWRTHGSSSSVALADFNSHARTGMAPIPPESEHATDLSSPLDPPSHSRIRIRIPVAARNQGKIRFRRPLVHPPSRHYYSKPLYRRSG